MDASYSFAFGATGTSKTSDVKLNGLMVHLQVTVPNFTNNVTCTPSIQNPDGVTVWTGPALARNASYSIDGDSTTSDNWNPQLVKEAFKLVMTLSNVAGGSGGTVTSFARAVGL